MAVKVDFIGLRTEATLAAITERRDAVEVFNARVKAERLEAVAYLKQVMVKAGLETLASCIDADAEETTIFCEGVYFKEQTGVLRAAFEPVELGRDADDFHWVPIYKLSDLGRLIDPELADIPTWDSKVPEASRSTRNLEEE